MNEELAPQSKTEIAVKFAKDFYVGFCIGFTTTTLVLGAVAMVANAFASDTTTCDVRE